MTNTTSAPPADLAARNRLVIALLLVSGFVVILNETIMGVALPNLMESFEIAASTAQWVSTAFMLTMAVVIPITGFLLQRFHTRTVFTAAMSLFSLGTLFAALAPTFELLVAARVVQAGGTAIMMPLLFTTVLTLVEPAHRGRVMGNVSIVISVAPAIGPTISGIILNFLEWRWMFILVLPIAISALVLGLAKIPNVTEPRATPLDVVSIPLTAFGFGGLVFGLSNLGPEGFGYIGSWLPLVVGVVSLAGFVLRQIALQKSDRALLDLRTFRNATFTRAISVIAISMVALFGTIVLLPIYMQDVLGLEPIDTGLLLLPGGLLMGLLAPFVGRAYDRIGPRPLVITGSIIVSATLWGMTLLGEGTSQWWVLAAHVVLSLGLAFMFTPLFTAGLGDLQPHLYSHGSAIVGTTQQVAGAIGTALFITVMSGTITREMAAGVSEVSATADGVHTAFLYGAVISLVAIPLAFMLRRPANETAGAPPVH